MRIVTESDTVADTDLERLLGADVVAPPGHGAAGGDLHHAPVARRSCDHDSERRLDSGFRVCRPYGKITLATWTASTPDSDLLRQLASALNELGPGTRHVWSRSTSRERALLLRIARDVAHATERQNAPLARLPDRTLRPGDA